MYRLLKRYDTLIVGDTDAELLGEVVHKIFYRNKDLNLLLVLLASASGIANTFFVMVLFDEDFRYDKIDQYKISFVAIKNKNS